MAKDWKKLARRITEDRYLTELFDAYPRAEGVFYRMIAAADDYGRLPADTPLLRAKICPRSALTDRKITTEVNRLVNSGKVARYSVRGEEYLAIVNYHRYQETDWSKTGKPEYPAPPDWEPPAELVSFVESHATTGKFPWSRYGVNEPQRTSENLSAPQTGEVQHRSLREIEIEMEIEREGDARGRAGTPSEAEQAGKPDPDFFGPPPVPQDAHLRYLGNEDLVDVFREIRPQWRGQKLVKWVGALAELLEENPQITRETVRGWLRAKPPDSGSNAGIWWDRQKREVEVQEAKAPVAYTSSLPDEHWEDPFVRICDRPREVQDQLSAWKSHCLLMDPAEENPIKDWLKAQLADYAAGTLTADDFPFPPAAEPQEAAV